MSRRSTRRFSTSRPCLQTGPRPGTCTRSAAPRIRSIQIAPSRTSSPRILGDPALPRPRAGGVDIGPARLSDRAELKALSCVDTDAFRRDRTDRMRLRRRQSRTDASGNEGPRRSLSTQDPPPATQRAVVQRRPYAQAPVSLLCFVCSNWTTSFVIFQWSGADAGKARCVRR